MNTNPNGLEVVTDNTSVEAKVGKRIMLGQIFTSIEFPNGKVLEIRRMPMSAEIRFVEYYNEMVAKIKGTKDTVLKKLEGFMAGEKAVKFGLMEGLEMIGQLFGQLPAFQDGVVGAVMIIANASPNCKLTADEIKESLSTADCLEILSAQSEVQGLLGSFRSILAGLSTKGVV